MEDRARLTLDLDLALHRRLKLLAAQEGVSMRELCVDAIERRLAESSHALILRRDDPLGELWDNEEDAIYDNL